jgi:hypothetical protein
VLISGVMMEVVKLDSDSYIYDSEFDTSSHTVSSGYDGRMEQGFEDSRSSSRIPKFTFTENSDDSSPEHATERASRVGNCISLRHHSVSPPYRKVRAVRLFDSPATKTWM